MSRFWKKLTGNAEPDPQAVEKLLESKLELAEVKSKTAAIDNVSGYLATRREQNHFGDALTISFTPRSRHV